MENFRPRDGGQGFNGWIWRDTNTQAITKINDSGVRVDKMDAAKSLQSCPTLRPDRRQPTRLLCPWDSPPIRLPSLVRMELSPTETMAAASIAATPWTWSWPLFLRVPCGLLRPGSLNVSGSQAVHTIPGRSARLTFIKS